ncbi:MAG: hypothetical protein JJ896_09640 [Rhodothermales bacterium]|nr:hypothetical protein [Rhodothermales bacterium]MBO6779901.1 hypothetical protein [Rhodothermales bacterium]
MEEKSQDLSIDYDTPVVARFASYLEGVLISHTVVMWFNLARNAGLSYDDSLDLLARYLPFSRTTINRRLKDWAQQDSFLKLSESDQYLPFVTNTEGWPNEIRRFMAELQELQAEPEK